jgi:hypothetical protein
VNKRGTTILTLKDPFFHEEDLPLSDIENKWFNIMMVSTLGITKVNQSNKHVSSCRFSFSQLRQRLD